MPHRSMQMPWGVRKVAMCRAAPGWTGCGGCSKAMPRLSSSSTVAKISSTMNCRRMASGGVLPAFAGGHDGKEEIALRAGEHGIVRVEGVDRQPEDVDEKADLGGEIIHPVFDTLLPALAPGEGEGMGGRFPQRLPVRWGLGAAGNIQARLAQGAHAGVDRVIGCHRPPANPGWASQGQPRHICAGRPGRGRRTRRLRLRAAGAAPARPGAPG